MQKNNLGIGYSKDKQIMFRGEKIQVFKDPFKECWKSKTKR